MDSSIYPDGDEEQYVERRRPYTFDRVARIVITLVVLVAIYYLLVALKGALLPFFVACLIAYMLEPVVKWNMKWMHIHSRFIPVAATLLETSVAIGLFCLIFIPYLVSEATSMAELMRKYAATQINIPFISDNIHHWIRENVDFETLSKYLSQDEWKSLIKGAISKSWNFVSTSVGFVLGVCSWLVVILYVIFIMLDYERLMLSFKQLVPKRHRRTTFLILNDIKSAMNRYFRGQFIIAFSVGVLFAIGFAIIKLPMGVVLGLFIGMLNMVPYLQLISLPITAVLCIVATVGGGVDFWTIFWESMAVYVVVQVIQDMILTPKVMGRAMGLNPAIILLSLSVWGTLLGFMGLIIALPLTTLILAYYNTYVVERINHDKRLQE